MEWIDKIEKSLFNDIQNCEEELQFYLNMEMEDDNIKKNKLKNILETITLKEQALIKWQLITKGIKK